MQTQRPALHDFFIATQARAFRQAEIAVGNRDDAMDIVQDAMIRLARNYSDREQEWSLLFHRILQNLIRDCFRRRKVRGIFIRRDEHSENEDEGDQDHSTPTPEQNQQQEQLRQQINAALQHLPLRQQQAFLLRSWWGHDVAETAYIMRCTEGSVKTHYSRALQKLKDMLGEMAP